MSTLVLLRHGQAAFGAERYDSLSDLGRAQAQAVGRHFLERGRRFSRVWVGPRERHRLTARYALEPLGLDRQIESEPALDEFAEGQHILASAEKRQKLKLRGEGAVSHVESVRAYSVEIDAWVEGRVLIDGVPDVRTFRATVAGWLSRATGSSAPGQNLIAVTSAGVIAAVVAIVLEVPDTAMAGFMRAVHNASLTELAFSAGRVPALVSFNASTHLPDDLLSRV
ncbi:MAG: histidine phosphatase family protein [Panacagrimonas sp.]